MFQSIQFEVFLCIYQNYIFRFLELCALRCTWERYDVANVLHTRYEEDETLEAETEACVRA